MVRVAVLVLCAVFVLCAVCLIAESEMLCVSAVLRAPPTRQ